MKQLLLIITLLLLSSCAHKLYRKLSEEELQQMGDRIDMLIGDCENIAMQTGAQDGSRIYELAFNNCITEKASSYDSFNR